MQQSHQTLSNGLQSFADVSPDYALAPVGIGSIRDQAEKLAEYGRNGDIYIVHAAEGETVVPMEVLEANPKVKELLFGQMRDMGLDPQEFVVGSELNSINPDTGMPEFFFKKIFRAVKRAVKGVAKIVKKAAPIVLPIAATAFGVPFLGPMFGAGTIGAGFLGGVAGSLAGGGSLKDSLKSGLISGGIAGLAGGLSGAFSSAPGSSFVGGLKESFTGASPVFSAGRQVGTQYAASPYALGSSPGAQASAAASKAQMSALGSGDFGRAFMGEGTLLGDTPTSIYDPATMNIKPGFTNEGLVPKPAPINTATTVKPSLGVIEDTLTTPMAPPSVIPPDGAAVPVPTTTAPPSSGAFSSSLENFGSKASDLLFGKTPSKQAIEDLAAQYIKKFPKTYGGTGGPARAVADATAKLSPGVIRRYGPAALIGAGGLYASGLFDTPPPPDDPNEFMLAGNQLTGIDLLRANPGDFKPAVLYTPETIEKYGLNYNYNPNVTRFAKRRPVAEAAKGGIMSFPRRETLVRGPGTERSDDIPAMLSDGEFVMTAKAVRGAAPNPTGNKEKDRENGAKNMYAMMRNFEMRA